MSNPLLDEFMKLCGDAPYDLFGREVNFERSLELFQARDRLCSQYAWAIPDEAALDMLVELSPVVEIGGGLGYWGSLVNEMGGDMIVFDKYVNERGHVRLYNEDTNILPYMPVFKGEHEAAELHADRTLFLCWPPYGTDMGYLCLKTYLDNGGHTLVYVGEGEGGCTADDAFHELMESKMVHQRTIRIPSWQGLHDRFEVWMVE